MKIIRFNKILFDLCYLLLDRLFFIFILLIKYKYINSNKKRILFIRTDNLGDFLLWSTLFNKIRCIYPKNLYYITIIANEVVADLLINCDIFDEVILFNRKKYLKNIIYRFNKLFFLRKLKFDFVINAVYSREFYWSDSFAYFANSPCKYALDGSFSNRSKFFHYFSNSFYTNIFVNNNTSEFLTNNFLLESLSCPKKISGIGIYNILGGIEPLMLEKKYYVMAPGASVLKRAWPVENFAYLAKYLHTMFGLQGIIVGTNEDATICSKIAMVCGNFVENQAGNTNLLQLASLIKGARILLTNETGVAHIGALSGTPTFCLTGGGHYGRFTPYSDFPFENKNFKLINKSMDCYGCNWICKFSNPKTFPCLQNIDLNDVMKRLTILLSSDNS